VHCRQHIQLHLCNILEQSFICHGYSLMKQLLSVIWFPNLKAVAGWYS
jgi:hypothetical protein